MTHKSTTAHTLACISLALLATACSKKNEDPSAPAMASMPAVASVAASTPAATASNAAAKPAEAGSSKLQDYIACYNKLDGDAHRSIARYQSWVKDMDKGPNGKEMVVYGLYKIDMDDIAKCKASFGKAAQSKLDNAATAYIDILSELGALVTEAEVYYSRDNYKDDAFAKGKKLHAPLADAMKRFEEKSNVFSNEIEVENDKALDAEMQQLEKSEGRQLPYLQMALMSKAKQLVRLIGEESFDAAAAGKLLADYESLTDEAIAYAKKNSESAASGWSTLERATEDYRKAAKERVRRIRDKVAYSEGEKMMLKPGSGWMVEGSQEKVTKAYNAMIEASNRMNR
ncbi:MAG: YiiG family protein [Undibacterium umbellatum]|uniref:YiiG family protein n=1 Tax=Undibacterium umbellatum TaxID=2762300 RepID=UPI003BB6C0F8